MKIFICQECNEKFSCAENLSKHVKHHGMINQQYYDKWLKTENEDKCKECGNITIFNGVQKGYNKYCSLKCAHNGNKKQKNNNKQKIKNTYKFECKECYEKFKTSIKLNNHIIKFHIKKEYYDKYLKKENEGFCKICNTPTSFTGRLVGKYSGYEMCCSKECREKYKLEKRTKTNLYKYGVTNVYQLLSCKEKIRQTFIKHYGVDHNMKSDKGKKEFKKSMINKYGVEWPLQNKESLEKNQKSAKKLKQFRDTNIYYQGSYELDFLEKYYDKYPDIQRGPSIKYEFNGNKKVYHSDFYIPSKNLIIEIKSSWILKIDIEINEKKIATISNGYNYIMILDKNYVNIESFFS